MCVVVLQTLVYPPCPKVSAFSGSLSVVLSKRCSALYQYCSAWISFGSYTTFSSLNGKVYCRLFWTSQSILLLSGGSNDNRNGKTEWREWSDEAATWSSGKLPLRLSCHSLTHQATHYVIDLSTNSESSECLPGLVPGVVVTVCCWSMIFALFPDIWTWNWERGAKRRT